MSEPAQAPRAVGWTIAILFAILLVWAIVAKLDIVAVAEGRLVPQTYVKIVQPADAGIVREILVDEGDYVEKGQVLLRLDPTENAADSIATSRELALQRLQVRRVDAELRGVPMQREQSDDTQLFVQVEAQRSAHRQQFQDAVAQEVASRERAANELGAAIEVLRKLEKTLPSYQRSADAYQKLATDHLVGELDAEAKRREALEKEQDLESQLATVASLRASLAASDRHLEQLKSAYASDLHTLRVDAVSKVTQLDQQRAKLQFHQDHLELRAPQAGVVKELATTTIGAVVQPGTVLLSLVPRNEPLLAEVSIQNEDIGFVREGQAVRVKLATYPFQKYGTLDGVVRTVIADSSQQDARRSSTSVDDRDSARTNSLSFKAMVDLREQSLRTGDASFPLAAGMQLSAEIVEGGRTVLEYLLSPVQKIASEAGVER
ncbi:MAG: HlyD family type I secretion periplasmic adaptor subunit [Gammaproteobacteria bacterium]